MKKILLIVFGVLVAAGLVAYMIHHQQSSYTKVQTAKLVRQDLSTVVSGTGQIKPKTYANLGATAMGRITHLYVKEGDHVKKGQVVATVENVQQEANVHGQRAAIDAARTDINSYLANEKTQEANLEHAKADLAQKKLDWERADQLYKAGVNSKATYDAAKASYETDVASVNQALAQFNQAKAQTDSARGHMHTQEATLKANQDLLSKTIATAPFDGLVTNEPVREGETVVEGIQNTSGSTFMTISDMSIVTAEVKVDETDIINIRLGQEAAITVDALPGKTFKGHVTLVGDQALLRSTGIATSQSTTGAEEAKDFKVIVTLDEPNDTLRPGLSCTAKVTTAHKPGVVALPIQALTLYDASKDDKKGKSTTAAASSSATAGPQQGVFVVNKDAKGSLRAQFVAVTTGITGATDIEVLTGLTEGQEIVTGPYKTLRALKNNTLIKRDTIKIQLSSSSSGS